MNTERRLYQWDTGQKLVGCTGLYVDFPIDNEVYRVETADGMCIIPDELLQTSGSHKVYECMTNNTIRSFAFSVTPRPKPPDYVYTPTERLTFEGLVQKVDDAVADMIRRAESGEFDGHTPVKGTDYFTTEEIQQIQNEVSSGAIGEFKSVVDTETETFNNNAETKLTAYNQNDSQKTTAYNTNAETKRNAYNANADNRVAEFDAHTEQIQTDISELKSDLSDLAKGVADTSLTKEVEAVKTVTGKRVSISDTYVTITGVAEGVSSIKVFPVKKGNKYKAYGFGYDREEFYIGGISDTADIESVQTLRQKLLCGTDVYPSGYTYHYVEFVAEASGYLSLTYRTAQSEAKLIATEYKPKVVIDYSNAVIKNGDEYNYLCRAYGDIFASRTFKHCNANNLFQLYKIGYGTFDGTNYTESQNVMTAETDIVGPVSIGRWNSSTGYESGKWSGGNHSKTIEGLSYKTAEETTFKAYCNGIDITTAEDGVYIGNVTFIAENDLYFPQTITDDSFTNAVKAIHETRVYKLSDDMHVKVSLEMLYDYVGVIAYYGMQMQIPTDVVSIEYPSIEKLIKRSDATKIIFNKPSNIMYLNTENGWHYDMVLDCIGLQDRSHVTTEEAYFNDYGYGNVVASFSKAYQQLIVKQHYASGTLLTWSGTYKMYHD